LGVHWGDSYFAFCQAVKEFKLSTKCWGIDLFKGDDLTGYYNREVYNRVMEEDDKYQPFSTILETSFDSACTTFKDSSIDLLHIDGSHYYVDVKHDFETWLPKVNKCGIILFHDTNVLGDRYGVWRFWKEIKKKYLTYQFDNKYGLGILCLGREYPQSFLDLFK